MYGGKGWKKRGGRGGRVLKVPEPFIPPAGARIMSLQVRRGGARGRGRGSRGPGARRESVQQLPAPSRSRTSPPRLAQLTRWPCSRSPRPQTPPQDGTSKMSKSAENDASRINLTDDAAAIAGKIKRCKTDAVDGLEFGNPDRPEANNLLTLYQLATGRSKDEVADECGAMRWGAFKPLLADALVAHLEPIQARYNEAVGDAAYLDAVLARGAENAAEQANATLAAVRDAMGFVPPARKF